MAIRELRLPSLIWITKSLNSGVYRMISPRFNSAWRRPGCPINWSSGSGRAGSSARFSLRVFLRGTQTHRLKPAPQETIRRSSYLIPTEERSRLPVAFLIGIVIVALLVGAAVLYSRYATPASSEEEKPLPNG